MIRQTQDSIDEHFGKRKVPRPRRFEPGVHGRTHAEILGHAKPPAATGAVRVRPSDSTARVVELQPNDHGYLDEARVRELEVRLMELVGPGQRGDVVIDLSRVRSLNSRFLVVVESVRKRLHDQRRRIVLGGLQPRCPGAAPPNRLKPTVDSYDTDQ